jgi:hypothetical protein
MLLFEMAEKKKNTDFIGTDVLHDRPLKHPTHRRPGRGTAGQQPCQQQNEHYPATLRPNPRGNQPACRIAHGSPRTLNS